MSDRNPLKATLTTLASSHAHLDQAHRSPRCLHVKSNGVRCGSPAMRRNPFCFFHDRYYNAPAEDTFPPLEDANAVQIALMRVLERLRREALRPGSLDLRAVNSLLYGLQTAAFNTKRTSFDSYGTRREIVTDDPLLSDREDREATEGAAAPRNPPAPQAPVDAPARQVSAPDFSRGSTSSIGAKKGVQKDSSPFRGGRSVL
jgi:hypothetical protein